MGVPEHRSRVLEALWADRLPDGVVVRLVDRHARARAIVLAHAVSALAGARVGLNGPTCVHGTEARCGQGDEDHRVPAHRLGDALATSQPGGNQLVGVGLVRRRAGRAAGSATLATGLEQSVIGQAGAAGMPDDLAGLPVDPVDGADQADRAPAPPSGLARLSQASKVSASAARVSACCSPTISFRPAALMRLPLRVARQRVPQALRELRRRGRRLRMRQGRRLRAGGNPRPDRPDRCRRPSIPRRPNRRRGWCRESLVAHLIAHRNPKR